ncbi:hypothetical protein ES703_17925 [subsurface metagenome]
MKIPIFMIFQFFGIISAWAAKALEDGKITAAEGLELVVALAGVLGVQLDFDVSDYLKPIPMLDPDGDSELLDTTETEPPPVVKPEE